MRSTAGLSLEQAPPFSVPLRFFLTAPLFGMVAGVLLLVLGPDVFAHRWSPSLLSLTHLLTIGFLSMSMCGALLQVLPVLGGVAVPAVRLVGSLVHLLLVVGTLCLAWGFLSGSGIFFLAAIVSLVLSFGIFIAAIFVALLRVKLSNPSARGIQAALLSLCITLCLGLYLAAQFAGLGATANITLMTDLHLAWGLLGWVGLLVIGVAFQVIPLFQMSPEYRKSLQVGLVPGLLSLLVVWSVSNWLNMPLFRWLLETVLVSGFVGFAVVTLSLLRKRRRRVPDISLLFWRTFGGAVIFLGMVWLAGNFIVPETWSGYPLVVGVGLVGGVGLTVINGMLYKIVPFLSWFHLQHRQMATMQFGLVEIPNMKKLLSYNWARRQFWLHLAMLGCALMATVSVEWFVRPLGLLMLLSFALLWLNLFRAAVRYRQADRRLSAAASAAENASAL